MLGSGEEGALIVRYLDLLTDPAHWLFELTVQLFVDGLVVGILWKFIFRDRLRRVIDREHEVHGLPNHEEN